LPLFSRGSNLLFVVIKMPPELNYYIILTLVILSGCLMIAGPHFPDSDVSQQINNEAFLALTILGILIIIPASVWMFKIFKATTWSDFFI